MEVKMARKRPFRVRLRSPRSARDDVAVVLDDILTEDQLDQLLTHPDERVAARVVIEAQVYFLLRDARAPTTLRERALADAQRRGVLTSLLDWADQIDTMLAIAPGQVAAPRPKYADRAAAALREWIEAQTDPRELSALLCFQSMGTMALMHTARTGPCVSRHLSSPQQPTHRSRHFSAADHG
ncbi:MAG TPA: hypothetical protein VF178_14895, partial [Gemmatimonadaceae bacterium]